MSRLSTALTVALLLLFCPVSELGAQSTSSSFILAQSAVSSGGGTAASSSFVLDGTTAQAATVGSASSASFVLEAGFWTGSSAEWELRITGTGSGRGRVNGPDFTCILDAGATSGDCTIAFPFGTTLGLIAAPDPANRFDGWSGCDSTGTTTLPGDTCQLTLGASRTVEAGFTLLGSIGDRVWQDLDGDGIQDPGEGGLDGVRVRVSDGAGNTASAVTAGDGFYSFVDVPPGLYTVAVDPTTLPPGHVPTYDLDGVATPHSTTVPISDGQNRVDVDFGDQPLIDLSLGKTDSADPLPGGDTLLYTLTVHNAGPAVATGVTVRDSLPVVTSRVATSGCAEDPAGTPSCTLGELAAGATASFTIEVAIDPAPPGSITNTATVAAVELDTDPSNNNASERTELDDEPPAVVLVDGNPRTLDGALDECETVYAQDLQGLVVQFDEAMYDPAGDTGQGDVSNPASWSLIAAGADAALETVACGEPQGDDIAIPIAAVSYDAASSVAVLEPAAAARPLAGLLRLIACGTGPGALRDLAGNPLDGDADGLASGDAPRRFRADGDNLLNNGHFDCDLVGWDTASADPAEISYSSEDLDGSVDSGSVAVGALAGGATYSLEQCVDLGGCSGVRHLEIGGWLWLSSDAAGIGYRMGCRYYAGALCSGESSAPAASAFFLEDTHDLWIELNGQLAVPAGSRSARCSFELTDLFFERFSAGFDQLWLGSSDIIFINGFENGSTSSWTAEVP